MCETVENLKVLDLAKILTVVINNCTNGHIIVGVDAVLLFDLLQ